MGKHKTKIERIANAKNRHLAFYKRKKGLLKKAMELSIMCDVHIFLCIFNTNSKKCAEFTTLPLQKLIDMYNNIPRKDVSVFAPWIEEDKKEDGQKITPTEWGPNTKEKLLKSAEIINKRKVTQKTVSLWPYSTLMSLPPLRPLNDMAIIPSFKF